MEFFYTFVYNNLPLCFHDLGILLDCLMMPTTMIMIMIIMMTLMMIINNNNNNNKIEVCVHVAVKSSKLFRGDTYRSH